MEGQITLADYQSSLAYDRRGKQRKAPEWAKRSDRCKDCSFWEILPESDQPPDGWGVYGQCAFLREGQKGYYQTDQYSYCDGWRSKWDG